MNAPKRCTITAWGPPENATFTKSRILGKVWRGPEFFGGRNSKIAVYRFVRRSSVYACAENEARTTQHESMLLFNRKRITQKWQNFPIFGITPWRPRGSESIVTWKYFSPTACARRVKMLAHYLEGLRKYLKGSEKNKNGHSYYK